LAEEDERACHCIGCIAHTRTAVSRQPIEAAVSQLKPTMQEKQKKPTMQEKQETPDKFKDDSQDLLECMPQC